jgi:hypothetical protein
MNTGEALKAIQGYIRGIYISGIYIRSILFLLCLAGRREGRHQQSRSTDTEGPQHDGE